MKEHEVIERLRRAFPDSGIGDDTAVLSGLAPLRGSGARGSKGGADLLFASDAIVEGVHFRRETSTLSQAIQKLVTSNVSDIYAMGGKPAAITLSAALAPGATTRDLDQIIDGLKRSCAAYETRLAGGDTVSSPDGFFFDVAVVGTVARGRAVLRSGARTGDRIVLFGEIGRSLAGHAIVSLLAGKRAGKKVPVPAAPIREALEESSELREAIARLALDTSERSLAGTARRFDKVPQAAEILRCAKRHLVPLASPVGARDAGRGPLELTAMIDVSDGLAKDLRTLCAESGVGAVVHEEDVPVPGGVAELFGLRGRRLADFAISSGEEYVLLAAARGKAGRGPRSGTIIGSFVPAREGIALVDAGGGRRPLPELGYEHSF